MVLGKIVFQSKDLREALIEKCQPIVNTFEITHAYLLLKEQIKSMSAISSNAIK